MGETPRPSDTSSSLAGTLARIGELLSNHPILLFAFGMAIILLGAGALALENLRVILAGIIVLTVLGMAAWIFTQLRIAQQAGGQPEVISRSSDIQVDSSAKIVRTKFNTGNVVPSAGSGANVSGGIHIGSGAQIEDSQFSTGGVGSTTPADNDADQPFGKK